MYMGFHQQYKTFFFIPLAFMFVGNDDHSELSSMLFGKFKLRLSPLNPSHQLWQEPQVTAPRGFPARSPLPHSVVSSLFGSHNVKNYQPPHEKILHFLPKTDLEIINTIPFKPTRCL